MKPTDPTSFARARTRAAALGLALAASIAAPLAAASAPSAPASAAPVLSVPALREAAELHVARGEIGEAVLAYERAAWLAPRDEALARGLAAARGAAGLPSPGPSALERAARMLPVRHATHVAAGAFWVAVFLALAVALTRRGRPALASAAAVSLAVAGGAAASVAARAPTLDDAVAIDAGAVRIAPFAGSEPVTTLVEGAVVDVQGRHGAFVRVRTATGAVGWVDGSRLARIVI